MTDGVKDARESILDRLDSFSVDGPPLPDVEFDRVISFDDPIAQFQSMLGLVGGEAHLVDSVGEVGQILQQIDVFREAKHVASLVRGIEGSVDARSVEDPHELSTLDWTIARGEFMVAENGSIWVDGESLPHRVLLFIAQYLAIVVPRSEIVSNMHEAYRRIEGFSGRFGVYVSGPSKTADIEQSLVLGAHGCRKLQVFLVDSLD